MIDLFTYIVYCSLLITSLILLTNANKKVPYQYSLTFQTKINFNQWLFILLISIVVGFRYEVGVDWFAYKADYDYFHLRTSTKFLNQYYEYGYYLMSSIFGRLQLGSEWLFFTISLLTWGVIVKGIPKFLLPLAIFYIFADEYFFWSMNGVRQFVAIAFWLLSIKYIIDKKLLKFVICIVLGSLFHQSVLLVIPFYFLNYNKIYNYKLFVGLFIVSLFLGSFKDELLGGVINLLNQYGGSSTITDRYSRYNESVHMSSVETVLGAGFYSKTAINFIIILLSNSMIKLNRKITPYFVLFSIGAILFNIFYDVQLIGRLSHYFLILRVIVLALITYQFWFTNKYRWVSISFTTFYTILFIWGIYKSSNNCSPYSFIP